MMSPLALQISDCRFPKHKLTFLVKTHPASDAYGISVPQCIARPTYQRLYALATYALRRGAHTSRCW